MNSDDIKASVCMATFNGEKFIRPQIESILNSISVNDEVIVSDDKSTDLTLKIISSYNDPRIKIFINEKGGVINNFQNAISNSSGDIIFLSDQDDVWMEKKRSVICKYIFENNYLACVSDCNIINEFGIEIANSFFPIKSSGPGVIKNLYKNTFLGCAMAFKKELKPAIIPFPPKIHMHDEWIGLVASICGEVGFIPEICFSYRRHSNNVSSMKHGSLGFMLQKRLLHVMAIAKNSKKIISVKNSIAGAI